MDKHEENLIPSDYWDELSDSDKETLMNAMAEAEEFLMNTVEWQEMDEAYYAHLRERFDKGPDEIGPREFKSFKSINLPLWMMVIPAGKQHDGEKMVQHFHTITEDLEDGQVNGAYELVTEQTLEEKFNIKYNN